MDALILFAQSYEATPEDGGAPGILIGLALLALNIASLWKVFEKAKQPGWAAIVPIYNLYILLKIAGRPVWWLWLYLIPFVNIVITIMVAIDIAKSFGKSSVFGVVGLWLFSLVGLLIIGFGEAKYKGVPKH